jgi:hypothetical protein
LNYSFKLFILQTKLKFIIMKKKELKKVLSFGKVTVLELNQLAKINGGDGGHDTVKPQNSKPTATPTK